jgi:hypothetical protein
VTPPASERRSARRRGDARRATPTAPRSLADRLDDPNEPLYTMAVAAELLGTDDQTLRRLGDALSVAGARPSGNQRRYSRCDLEAFEAGLQLASEGHPPQSIRRIVELERRLALEGGSGGAPVA